MSTHVDTDAPAETTAESSSRIRPHHLAIGLGVGIAVFTVVSGIVPLITEWHNDNERHREVFINIPGPLKLAFYSLIPVMLVWGALRFADRMKNWERGRAAPTRRTTTRNGKHRFADYRAGVYMRTLLRDPAAGLMHSTDLLQLPRPARRDDRAGDRPPDARGPQVPPGPHVPGLRPRRRRRRPHLRDRRGVGDPATLRAAPVPHQDQDQAGARPHPRHVPGDRAERLRRRDVPHRPADLRRRGHGLRAVELHRLSAEPARRRLVGVDAADVAPLVVGRARRGVHHLPGDPADHDAAAHVHVAVEHVPPPTTTARRGR